MKLLLLILAVVPIIATDNLFNDLQAQEFQVNFLGHARERRQVHAQNQQNYRPYSQAPSQIKQLLQAQQAREPIVHLPTQPIPRLGGNQPAKPQYQAQGQVSQYRPQVQFGSAPQQPTYKQLPAPQSGPQYRQPVAPQQPLYRPAAANYPQRAAQPNYAAAYKPIQAPQAAQQPQYSNRLPPQLQQLLQIQANLPNSIPSGRPSQSKAF